MFRFRSSHHCSAHSFANFGIKGTLATYDSSAVFGFEVPTQTRGYNDRNFKSTALGWRDTALENRYDENLLHLGHDRSLQCRFRSGTPSLRWLGAARSEGLVGATNRRSEGWTRNGPCPP